MNVNDAATAAIDGYTCGTHLVTELEIVLRIYSSSLLKIGTLIRPYHFIAAFVNSIVQSMLIMVL